MFLEGPSSFALAVVRVPTYLFPNIATTLPALRRAFPLRAWSFRTLSLSAHNTYTYRARKGPLTSKGSSSLARWPHNGPHIPPHRYQLSQREALSHRHNPSYPIQLVVHRPAASQATIAPFLLKASVHVPQYRQRHLQAQASRHSALYAPSYLLVPAGMPLLTLPRPRLIHHVALLLGSAPCAVL